MRDSFIKGGIEAINDIELLELILFRAIPSRDVRPLCQLLLKQFGRFNNTLAAAPSDLQKIKGIGIAVINELKIIRAAAHKMAQLDVIERDVISSWDQLIAYCRSSMAHLREEQFRVLFLNSKNVLIADECLQTGIVNHLPVYPRQVAKRALECDTTAVILVHNHPSGDPEPSQSDIEVTFEIIDALGALNIAVYDHLIIGAAGDISFKACGLI